MEINASFVMIVTVNSGNCDIQKATQPCNRLCGEKSPELKNPHQGIIEAVILPCLPCVLV